MTSSVWQVLIDRGGTFTDCLGRDPRSGAIRVAKVLSSDRAPLDGIRALLGIADDAPIPPCDLRMGTTIATNALLERRGVGCGLVITRGFRDLLEIGDQTRPDLFALDIRKPELLYREVLEVDARVRADGSVSDRPDRQQVLAGLAHMRTRGITSLAIVVLHAYRAPELELELADWARQAGFEHITCSTEVASEIGVLARGDTTIVDAYLTPLLRNYLDTLARELRGSSIRVMQSSGGLTDARRFRGRDAILSGPAGGVVACAAVARDMGHSHVIGFDMGGTSTDVSRWAGGFERNYETLVAGVRIRTPMMSIHTVAAGGGSICRYQDQRFVVGPESVGADPGPLCYGRPGAHELALTDVNLALGRLSDRRFPFTLDRQAVDAKLAEVAAGLCGQDRLWTAAEVAAGFFRVAVSNMAQAIREVTIGRGHDARDHAMVVFGGAAGQHACAVARRLGIRTLLFHPFAGVLSAYGMGVADLTWHGELDGGRTELDAAALVAATRAWNRLELSGRKTLAEEGVFPDLIEVRHAIDLRYRGTESALTLEYHGEDDGTLLASFHDRHRRELGWARDGHVVEVVTLRVEVIGRQPRLEDPPIDPKPAGDVTPSHARMWADGEFHDVVVLPREHLSPGVSVPGPFLVLETTGTIAVDPGWVLTMDPHGRIVLRDRQESVRPRASGTELDPVTLEIFNHRFMSIAEQMGIVLRRTALSTNIRDRLDFSCAMFDEHGGLVANAPHIPVHLGAMSESVRAIATAHPNPRPGDVFVTNDPAAGGSHLPDITVVTPVHHGGRLAFWVASRGHHADIGGITPGSMPPDSRCLDDEGVVLRGLRIVSAGELDLGLLREALASGSHPARQPDENLADLQAQIAANRSGEHRLHELVDHYGLDVVAAYMGHVQRNATARVAAAIAQLPNGEHTFADALDDGTPICVRVSVLGDRMTIDFSGTGGQVDGNLNAPRAVTVAAVLYVLRTLVGRPIPLNSGCLAPVELSIPAGSVLHPDPNRAVAGGNVETAQRVVDVLLGALGKAAASQGTMNNLTFGDASFGYYETIGGGAGAGPGFCGASGVHTHMTNTRITDVEVLETRYPVRVIEFSIRRGSGGRGRFAGGDGLVRELEFLAPVRVSFLSERRQRSPFGLAAGGPGQVGINSVDGRPVAGKCTVELDAGGRVRIETPGGGGYGPPPPDPVAECGGRDVR